MTPELLASTNNMPANWLVYSRFFLAPCKAQVQFGQLLDGTVVRVRLDRKATSISLLVVLGVRADGQKVLLAIKSMGGESAEALRTVLDDLIKRGLSVPSSSSSMARRDSRPLPPSGTECRCNAARSTSTETCSPIPRSACTTGSPRITTT